MLHISLCLPHIQPKMTPQLVKIEYSSINGVTILHVKMILFGLEWRNCLGNQCFWWKVSKSKHFLYIRFTGISFAKGKNRNFCNSILPYEQYLLLFLSLSHTLQGILSFTSKDPGAPTRAQTQSKIPPIQPSFCELR